MQNLFSQCREPEIFSEQSVVMLSAVCLLVLTSFISCQDLPAPALVTSSCCTQVFLSSPGLLAEKQGPALGIYTLSSQTSEFYDFSHKTRCRSSPSVLF